MKRIADKIRERAYHVWEREGRPAGRELEHWLVAESEFEAASAAPTRKRSTATKAKASSGKTKVTKNTTSRRRTPKKNGNK
jgi:hypothetical protein